MTQNLSKNLTDKMKSEISSGSHQDIWFSLVIPVFNEAVNLDELVQRCLNICNQTDKRFEVILVDDGSHDLSKDIIRKASEENPGQIIGVFLNRNYGQHAAVMAGLAQSCGEVVVTLDADLQNPPEEIPKLLARIEIGCDVVGSVRRNRQDTLFRHFSSRVINKAMQKSTGVMLRVYRRPGKSYIRRFRLL